MSQHRTFAFIAHYVEPWNWLLNFHCFRFLHRHPERRFLLMPLYPICWLASIYYLFRREPFQVVDSYQAHDGLRGYTILINNFGWHFLFQGCYDKIRHRINRATRYAQDELGVDVVGLGALTKAETVTQGGSWLADRPGIHIPVVHGDTCTAWYVIRRLLQINDRQEIHTPMAIIGPTSKVGRAVILYLAQRGYVFKAYTRSAERFAALRDELPERGRENLVHITDLADAQDCRVWVTGKFKPSGRELLRHIPAGATVINFAVPDPLSERHLGQRRDLTHIEGGLVQTSPECSVRFTMRLTPGVTYACTAGTMIHADQGWADGEIGAVSMRRLMQMEDASARLGMGLVPLSVSQTEALAGEAV